MTPVLILVFVSLLAVTAFLSAVSMSLMQASQSAIEEKLRLRGRSASAPWLDERRDSIEHAVAIFRTVGRLSCVLTMLLIVHDERHGPSPLIWQELAIAICISAALVWLATSVIAGAVARHRGPALVVATLPMLRVFYLVTRPVLWLGSAVDAAACRLLGALPTAEEAERELLNTIEDSARAGGLDRHAAQLLRNAVEFSDTVVSEVMTPRTQIEGIEYTDDLAAIRRVISHAGHSRIPVYKGSLDDALGVLYVKDLVAYLGTDPGQFKLAPLLRHPLRVPETKRVSALLRDFQHSEVHMAMVVDEFGGTAGLVTIEDVLEEIVGEIYDEHEPTSDTPAPITGDATSGWTIDGRVPLSELAEVTGLDLPLDADFDTAAGLALSHFGRVPAEGERFFACGAHFTIDCASLTRVARLKVVVEGAPTG
ncbi:MAG: HlyC/CorC family transporter [Phycisphaerales bacterium]|nr:HlyC/CorC family transporter [Phycisphaerales bacterium]